MDIPHSEDLGPSIKKFCICFIVFSTVAVALRFWSRALTVGPRKFWWDDWLALVTLFMVIVQLGITIWWTTFGLGKHAEEVGYLYIMKGLHVLFVGYFFFYFGVSLAKLSCLLFYARVFTTANKVFRISLWTTAGIVIAWDIFCIFSTIWECTPIEKAWNPLLPGHCLNTYKRWSSSGISNIIVDVIILLLPMPVLWSLKMERSRRLLLIGVFLCGCCVVIISTGKTITILKDNATLDKDVTFNIVKSLYWLSAEGPVSIISICIPGIFSLAKRVLEHGPHSLLSSKDLSGSSSTRGRNRENTRAEEEFTKLQVPNSLHGSHEATEPFSSQVQLRSLGQVPSRTQYGPLCSNPI